MTATVLCFACAKGGAGATTLAASTGSLFAGLGHTTLLIDAAPSTGGLTLFYLHTLLARHAAAGGRLRGVFDRHSPAEESFSYSFVEPNLAVVPLTYGPPTQLDLDLDRLAGALARLVHEAASFFDFIILDSEALSDAATAVAARFADHVIVAGECDALSMAQLESSALARIGALARGSRWLLPNKVTPEAASACRGVSSRERSLPPIPCDPEVGRAYAQRTVAVDLIHPGLFTVALLHALSGLSGLRLNTPARPLATDHDTLRRQIVERYRGIAAERNALRTQSMQLSAIALQHRRRLGLPARLAASAAVASAFWIGAVAAVLLGASSAWRALAYLIVVAGAAAGASTWYLLRRHAAAIGDVDDAIMELEALDERLMELGEEKQKWRTLFEYCSEA
jgi:cellulose biosynthesis protein BcsQ